MYVYSSLLIAAISIDVEMIEQEIEIEKATAEDSCSYSCRARHNHAGVKIPVIVNPCKL